MNQLFYNMAGGIEHQIRREKRTTISEVIVRVKRNIKQNRNWFYFEFSAESSSFIFNNFKTEKFKLTSEGSRPREKVGNCLRFGTGGWILCFYPLYCREI